MNIPKVSELISIEKSVLPPFKGIANAYKYKDLSVVEPDRIILGYFATRCAENRRWLPVSIMKLGNLLNIHWSQAIVAAMDFEARMSGRVVLVECIAVDEEYPLRLYLLPMKGLISFLNQAYRDGELRPTKI